MDQVIAKRTLALFSAALTREADILARWPELTWQQLHNRLQWAEPPLHDLLAPERERRSRLGARPWVHEYTRPRDSQAMVRTLSGHADMVNACAISPDGTWIASASHDGTLKVWDAATGVATATLVGHTDRVWGCAISPDGAWIVSASEDRTLRIWDAATGVERATLTGHAGPVNACAVSPDGAWIVSPSDDNTLKIWDVGHRRRAGNPGRPQRRGERLRGEPGRRPGSSPPATTTE